jgi:small subunit ribosomal protein S18
VRLEGKISRVGVLKYTPSGTAICDFTLAVPQRFLDKGSVGYFEAVRFSWKPSKENRMKKSDERASGGGGGGGGADRGERRSFQKRKGCRFCIDPMLMIDYKDKYLLQPFVTERFKIVPRRISGNCAAHQRRVTTAVKRARHIALLPYSTAQL